MPVSKDLDARLDPLKVYQPKLATRVWVTRLVASLGVGDINCENVPENNVTHIIGGLANIIFNNLELAKKYKEKELEDKANASYHDARIAADVFKAYVGRLMNDPAFLADEKSKLPVNQPAIYYVDSLFK